MEPGPSRASLTRSPDSAGQLLSPNYRPGVYDPQAKIVPPYGYTTHRPPPVFVEKQDRRASYELVNSADDREGYTDPYDRQDDNDTIPLFDLRRRSTGNNKRHSTMLPSTPLPRTPIPPGLAGGSGWLERFEPAPVLPLIIHTLLCIAAFPIIYYLSPLANGLSMFWARVIVGGIAGAVGLSLGVSLLDLARRGIEAALWATIIHESMTGDMGGVTLSELNYHTANPDSPWAATLLLYRRWFKHRGTGRARRKEYEQVKHGAPWSLYIVLFLLTVTVSACLVFAFGRVVEIYTRQVTQSNTYQEVTIIGDLSPEDIQRSTALEATFKTYIYTWSLTPFSATANLPKDRSFRISRPSGSGVEDALHFAETYTGQLVPGGAGFGTFLLNTTAVWAKATTVETSKPNNTMAIGETIRWPRWGERTVCQTMTEIPNNGLVLDPKRNTTQDLTYAYVTKAAIQGLLEYAEISNRSLAQLPPINFTSLMDPGDEPTPGVRESDVGMVAKWWDNGVAHQFRSEALDRGDAGNGWTMLEIVLVRLNETYTPMGQFPQYVPGGDAATRTRIGLDAALCVSEISAHMLDSYNNTAGLPITLGYLYDGAAFNTTGKKMEGEWLKGPQRGINSAGKWAAFSAAHSNARNVMIKDNGRDWYYVPNPTVVSFTGNSEPGGYTKLVAAELQDVLGDVDCQHLLPYLVGSQPIIAHTYPDKTLAYTKIYLVWLIVSLIVVLVLGFIVAIFVPRLPLGLPRRDFGVFSWIAAIEGDSLVNLPVQVGRYERLEDLERKAKNVPVKYANSLLFWLQAILFHLLLAPRSGSSSISSRPLGPAASAQLELPPPLPTTSGSMAQIEAKSWGAGVTVPEGRCVVNLDDSALRMLEPAQHRKNPAQSTYHSFKYHFKPESIDIRKPGKVQMPNPPRAAGDGGAALDVELLGPNSEDKHLFTAVEQATKELDVFMIFDPTTGAFTMYEADSSVILSYDRAASKAASRSRSKTSPAAQPLPIPALPKAAPAPAAPVRLPTASTEPSPATDSVKRSAVAPKAKRPKPKPAPVPKQSTPPPPAQEEAEEGELELEPVSIPIPAQSDLMEVDIATPTAEAEAEAEAGELETEPDGILPWHAVVPTLHKRVAAKTSTFTTTGPEEEVIEFGPSLGGVRDPPAKKGQNKSSAARSGAAGIIFPKAAPRPHQHREPPRPVPVPPPVQSNPDPEDDDFEEILPGVQDELQSEMMKVLRESSDEEVGDDDEDEDEDEEDENDEDGGFDVQAFQQALAQHEEDSDSDDDDSSSSEDEDD
ncbi:ATP-binding cassette sub-family C member 8 [Rhizoctonia solani]|uniref:ATP-binding cassette sub-family C member 8 n=1 Tax=Rhizoctonia solani TaxID=456999 RepID=A0A0K6FTB5_9AGAM|nr:ATP-binding cassette sub-family C member 8 [Rhizoctonia solani]